MPIVNTKGYVETRFVSEYQDTINGVVYPLTVDRIGSDLRPVSYMLDDKRPSSNGRWPALKGSANCTNAYYRGVRNGPDLLELEWSYFLQQKMDPTWTRKLQGRGASVLDISSLVTPGGTGELSNQYGEAKSKIFSKYQDEVTKFQGGTFLGELRETLAMIKNPAKALRKRTGRFLDTQKRVSTSKVKPSEDTIANTYLEYQFGAVPLMMDINEAVDAVRALNEREHIQRLTSSSPYESFSSNLATLSAQCVLNNGYNTFSYKLQRKRKGGVKFIGDFRVELAADRMRQFGLGPDNFVPTAYQLLPWSFLIDYFSNVGDVLSSYFQQYAEANWKSASYFLRDEYAAVLVGKNSPYANVSVAKIAGPRVTMLQRVDPVLLLDFSDVSFSIPGFDSDPWQWLNISALAKARTGSWTS